MSSERRIVQCPQLGKLGRFANWLIQYQWALKYSRHCDAVLQTHPWVGETVFEIHHERIESEVSITPADKLPYCLTGTVAIPMFFDVPLHYAGSATTRESVRSMPWKEQFHPSRVPQKDFVVHLRGGDFNEAWSSWPQVSLDDLLKAVGETGIDPKHCFVVSDDIPSENDIYPKELDYLYDFQLLLRAKVMFAYPCSTFSMIAGMMSDGTVYCPQHFHGGKTTCQFQKASYANLQPSVATIP